MYPFELCFSPDICLGVGLEDHMVTLFLVSQRISLLFSIVAVPIYSPINPQEAKLLESVLVGRIVL